MSMQGMPTQMTPQQQQQIMAQRQQQQQQQQQQQHASGPGGPPQGPPPQGQQSHPEQKFDNLSKAKALVPQFKDSLNNVFKNAALVLHANNMIDSGSKGIDVDAGKLDKSLEEFFSLCDQLEVNLKTAIENMSQTMNAQKYLTQPVSATKVEGNLTYPQFIGVVKAQINYAKELHNNLAEATQKTES